MESSARLMSESIKGKIITMQLQFQDKLIDPASLLSGVRTIISIGRVSDSVYNVIPIKDDGVEIFQCQLSRTADGWLLHNGQWRTECPKGITSRLQHACTVCMGRCVNPRPGRPKYSWRKPSSPTFLNGAEIPDEGVILKHGDKINIGNTVITALC